MVPGIEATMICDSSSSNPPAKITWWKDGIPVEGVNGTSKSGLWGGTVSSLDLKINVTQDMNEVVYTCQSNNEALQRSVHEAITLQVLCKSLRNLILIETIAQMYVITTKSFFNRSTKVCTAAFVYSGRS